MPPGAKNGQPVDETASALWGDCQLDENRYGFSDALYARAIDDIAIEQVLQIHGFVGHSFGAQRLSYLSEGATARLQWAVITRPYPVGASLRETIDARARLVDDAVGEAGVPIGEPVAVSGRSVDVTELDYWSALAGLGYVTEADWEQTRSAVVDGSDPSLIGSLSDQLWMRYGVDSLSPGMLAHWQEVCAVAGDLPPREAGGVAAVLDTFYAPCAGAERERERPPGGVELSEYRACVTVSPDDLVTPASLVRESFVGAEIVEVDDRSHSSLQGLDQCLARVGAGEAD